MINIAAIILFITGVICYVVLSTSNPEWASEIDKAHVQCEAKGMTYLDLTYPKQMVVCIPAGR